MEVKETKYKEYLYRGFFIVLLYHSRMNQSAYPNKPHLP